MSLETIVIRRPRTAKPLPILVNIPHTGTRIPNELSQNFASRMMGDLPMTDWHLESLYDFLPDMGITMVHNVFNRVVVDLNRPAEGDIQHQAAFQTGLVPLETFDGDRIWKTDPTADEVRMRINTYYVPYHQALRSLVSEMLTQHETLYFIDAHSINGHACKTHPDLKMDVYLGNQNGKTCGDVFMNLVEDQFKKFRYHTAQNDFFDGGYTTALYGANPRIEAMQIEMRQRMYMEEGNPYDALYKPQFSQTKQDITDMFDMLVTDMRHGGLLPQG